MANSTDYNSVDLTEDEDSRETVTDVMESQQLPFYSYTEINGNTPRLTTLSPSTPPPLTPICEINSLRGRELFGNQHRTVPKLKEILRSSNKEDHTTLSEQISLNQHENNSVNLNYDCSLFQSSATPSKSAIGKEWTIKKDGKTYKIVIPYNVMPTLNQTNGSVVVNVPEVGPIMLKINPCFKDPSVSELQPFSLNFDEIMESTTEPVMHNYTVQSMASENVSQPEKEIDLLYDPRFCWVQPKYRNYIYSFNMNFTGFSKTDMQKARRCVRNFTMHAKKLENIFAGKKFEIIKKHIKIANKSKVSVNINETSGYANNSNIYLSHKKFPVNWLKPSDVDIEAVLTPNVMNTDSSFANDDTGKRLSIPIIKRHSQMYSGIIKRKVTTVNLKHCFIKIVKDIHIENLIKSGNISKSVNGSFKRNPRKSTSVSLENVRKILLSKLIKSEVKFKSEISFLKPLLLLNEHNFEKVLYLEDFCKSNIVYAVNKQYFSNKVLENDNFVLAVKKGYVKLVECSLVFKYLKGEFGPITFLN